MTVIKTFQALDVGIANLISIAERPAFNRNNQPKTRGLPTSTPSSPIRAGLTRYRMWLLRESHDFERGVQGSRVEDAGPVPRMTTQL